jgi:hypothetical protein
MERHCARNGIYQDIVSPGNHKANGLAERYVGTLHDTMTQVPDKKLGEWYKYCEPIAHCLRVTPCSDTEVSPLEMLTGRRAKHPYHQPIDITFVRSDPVGKDERRKAYVRARKVMKYEQEHSEEPVRAYVRNVQTFSANELVRMKVEGSQAPALMGRPRKWTQRWAEKRDCVRTGGGTPRPILDPPIHHRTCSASVCFHTIARDRRARQRAKLNYMSGMTLNYPSGTTSKLTTVLHDPNLRLCPQRH